MIRTIAGLVVFLAVVGLIRPALGMCCTTQAPAEAGAHDCCPASPPSHLQSVRNCCPEAPPGDPQVTLTAAKVLVTPTAAAVLAATPQAPLNAAPALSQATHLPTKPLVLRI